MASAGAEAELFNFAFVLADRTEAEATRNVPETVNVTDSPSEDAARWLLLRLLLNLFGVTTAQLMAPVFGCGDPARDGVFRAFNRYELTSPSAPAAGAGASAGAGVAEAKVEEGAGGGAGTA